MGQATFRAIAVLILLATLCPASEEAAPPQLDLFSAGEGGYTTCRIPGLVVTAKGTLLAYCEARRGVGDWSPIDILLRRSTDGGKTWEPARKIAKAPKDVVRNPVGRGAATEGTTLNNPVMIADPSTGVVHFLYCVNYARCFVAHSDDDGKTFSPPTEITATFDAFRPEYDWKVLATGPGHGIRLKNGRLLVPIWLSLGTGPGGHRPSCGSTIHSDDAGQTWHRGQIVITDTPQTPNPSESTAAQLSDGTVMLNLRTESARYRRMFATSPTGSEAWTKPAFDDALLEPICEGALLALPTGDLLFLNPANPEANGPIKEGPVRGKPRKNLTLRVSKDSGKTWPVSRVLDAGPAGYSDLAAGAGGSIYVLYERGKEQGNAFNVQALTFLLMSPSVE